MMFIFLQCSGDCMNAVQVRQVTCADSEGKEVPDRFCTATQPPATQSCSLECDPTRAEWMASKWSEVSLWSQLFYFEMFFVRIFFNCKPVWLYYDRYSVQFHINIALTNMVLMHFRVSKKTYVVFQHKKCGVVELHVYCWFCCKSPFYSGWKKYNYK